MTLFLLLCGHALADFSLQSAFMSVEKNPWAPVDAERVPPGQTPTSPWFWVLTAHALIHGGTVALVTNCVSLGIAETIAHWFIDFAKCGNLTTIHADQMLHYICKFVWFLILIHWM